MASATLAVGRIFPDGTSVGAYDDDAQPPSAGVALGNAVATATVSGGSVTFTGLTAGTRYDALAVVSGSLRRIGFFTPPAEVTTSELDQTEGMGVIVHGSTAATERPNNYAQYTWIGTVEPDNMDDNDIWIDTT